MNYRELYDLIEDNKSDLSKIIKQYDDEIKFYKKNEFLENIKKDEIISKIFNMLIGSGNHIKPLDLVENINNLVPNSMSYSYEFVNYKNKTLNDITEEMTKLRDFKELNYLIDEKNMEIDKFKSEIRLDLEKVNNFKELHTKLKKIENDNIDENFFEKAKKLNFFTRLIYQIPKSVIENIIKIESDIKNNSFIEVNTLQIKDYKKINNFFESKISDLSKKNKFLDNLIEEQKSLCVESNIYHKYIQRKTELSVENYLPELKKKIIEELIEKDNLKTLMSKLDIEKDYEKFLSYSSRIQILKDLQKSLEDKKDIVNNQINKLSENDSKLLKAKRKAGSKTVKNFDETNFNKSMSQFKNINRQAINWTKERRDNIINDPIIDNNVLLFWGLMLMLDDDKDSISSGAFLLNDKIDDIKNLDFSNIEVSTSYDLDYLEKIGGNNLSLDNLSELSNLDEISKVNIDFSNFDIPKVDSYDFDSGYSSSFDSGYSSSSSFDSGSSSSSFD